MNLLGALGLLSSFPASGQECGLPATAEKAGFSVARLKKLDDEIRAAVDQKILPGAVITLARHGKVVECKSYGYQDIESAKPVRTDTIFSIASMTKPVIGVAMMILYEEGKWQAEDPVAKYIPELANLRVFAGTDANGKMILEEPKHTPTIEELMTHTAGFTTDWTGSTPVNELYKKADLFNFSSNLTEFAQKVGQLPLLYQPGERWAYSISVDIQGGLVERLSGKPLAAFLQERIFAPLKMRDTAFYVPEDKWARYATAYSSDATGALKAEAFDPNDKLPPTLPSGGTGLVSTVADYTRFCQMLLNGGELDGVRILSPSAVRLLRTNHLPDRLLADSSKWFQPRPGQGYGYDVGVEFEPSRLGRMDGKDTFHWLGSLGTWFWVDPTNDLLFVGMIQRSNYYDLAEVTRALTYQALVKP
jgi:CubicO group peptidase (beta-lactamase class C family)